MTEISDDIVSLPGAIERFILQWGDMGGQWGVNRSVSQIHALLYLSERPLTAEAIAESLGLARSNVSNSIKELLAWTLIRRVPIKGDRRDDYEAETDLWEVAARIAAGRIPADDLDDAAQKIVAAWGADARRVQTGGAKMPDTAGIERSVQTACSAIGSREDTQWPKRRVTPAAAKIAPTKAMSCSVVGALSALPRR